MIEINSHRGNLQFNLKHHYLGKVIVVMCSDEHDTAEVILEKDKVSDLYFYLQKILQEGQLG